MAGVLAFAAVGAVMILAVVLIVAALVFYLVSVIVALRKITTGLDEVIVGVGEIVQKSAPVNGIVTTINQQLDAGVDALEGLLVKKAGMRDAVGLVDGLYAGAAAAGFRNFPESTTITAPRIAEVYTKGTLTLARLGREAPIAACEPGGPGAQEHRGGKPGGAATVPRDPSDTAGDPAAVSGDRRRRARAVRAARRHRGPAQAPAQPLIRRSDCAQSAETCRGCDSSTETIHDAGAPTGSCSWPLAHHQLSASTTAALGTFSSMSTQASAPSVIALSHEYSPANARLSERMNPAADRHFGSRPGSRWSFRERRSCLDRRIAPCHRTPRPCARRVIENRLLRFAMRSFPPFR